MKIKQVQVEAVKISDLESSHALDPIHVFWLNVTPGEGYVTIICYGTAWTAYFGGMSGRSIQEFFRMADVGYLVNKLGPVKPTKKEEAYLKRVVEAVKESVK